jgi:hypothetical protein
MHRELNRVNFWLWTSAAVILKGEELHVKISAPHIPNSAITTWRRSAAPRKKRGNPAIAADAKFRDEE